MGGELVPRRLRRAARPAGPASLPSRGRRSSRAGAACIWSQSHRLQPARMGVMPTRDQVLEALKVVIDPELRRDIVELEMVRAIEIRDGGTVDVTVSLTTPGCPRARSRRSRTCGASAPARAAWASRR